MKLLPLIAVLAAGLTLSACGDSSAESHSGHISIVASTNVWGDIAASVGGDRVDVTSIMSKADQDPHSFEANSRVALKLSKADLIIENGGGYDDFVGTLLKAHPSDAPIIDAVKVSGKSAAEGAELNEHVWYDFATVSKVADAIATRLGKLDPSHAGEFTTNAQRLSTKIDGLTAQTANLKSSIGGKGIAITEPVPLYLTDAMGLVNRTPPAFSEAVEEGGDVSPVVLQETLDLFTQHRVDALVLNAQTTDAISQKVETAATNADIPVVKVTETLPTGLTYVSWMQSNINDLSEALTK